jgi:hypothetical protein
VVPMLLTALASVWPLLLLPFVNILPYLQSQPFAARFFFSVNAWLCTGALWFVIITAKERRVISALFSGWKDIAGTVAGIAMFAYFAAELSANTFGSLVKVFPGQSYMQRFEVMNTESAGSKYKSVTLELRSQSHRQAFYLTLSKRLFDYPQFNGGEVLMLKGKQNFFGVYVDDVELGHR